MRRVFRGGAVLALIAILVGPAAYADDPPGPFDPPEARIRPPGGVTAQEEPTFLRLFLAWLESRISIPNG